MSSGCVNIVSRSLQSCTPGDGGIWSGGTGWSGNRRYFRWKISVICFPCGLTTLTVIVPSSARL